MRDRSKNVKENISGPDAVGPDTEGTNVLFDVWLVSRATTDALDRALAPSGLTADEFGIYSVLTSAESLTPSELARWMSAPLTTVSSYVKRIEGRGHLTRARNPEDGRSYDLSLTQEGQRAHQAAGARFLPVLDAVDETLGRRVTAVRRALTDLRRTHDGMDTPES
jgi:DNA-binding MarR family transcriptional regulator